MTTLFGNRETLSGNHSLLYQTRSKIPHETLPLPPLHRKGIQQSCPLGLKRMNNCITDAKMPTIKTLTDVQYMPPTPKPVQFHVRIHKNEANDVTYTLSRQQPVETPVVGSLKMNTALEYSIRVVQEGDRRCKKSTLNDLAYLTPLRIPLMNPVLVENPPSVLLCTS